VRHIAMFPFIQINTKLGPAFRRTGVVDLYPCVGLNTPGETCFVNFAPPFVFDHVAAQTGGIGSTPSSMEEVILFFYLLLELEANAY